MLRAACVLSAILVALSLVGCGGSSRSGTTGDGDVAGAATEAATEEAPAAEEESGIPGLTVAEVEAQPEAPEAPSRFGVGTTYEEVEAEAAEMAEREARRDRLGEVTEEQRTIYLAHVWWQAVRTIQRDQPSDIPGLTVGEVEDQPAVPPLPELFDLAHDRDDLRHHAFLVASEEQATGGLADSLGIAARQTYLVWAWEPLLAERQERYRAALAERQAVQDYQLEDARRQATWEADIRAHRRETDRLIEAEKRKTIPVLTPYERWQLRQITAHPRR